VQSCTSAAAKWAPVLGAGAIEQLEEREIVEGSRVGERPVVTWGPAQQSRSKVEVAGSGSLPAPALSWLFSRARSR
jgi:hypothetical protein